MVASNVHGKNQHIEGCFHNFILSIDLLDKNKKILTCSKFKNKILFDYTVGGMGLTGIILSASIKLKKIYSSKIIQKTKVLNNINQIVEDMKKISMIIQFHGLILIIIKVNYILWKA